MQVFLEVVRDQGEAFLGAEHDVVKQIGVGARHGFPSIAPIGAFAELGRLSVGWRPRLHSGAAARLRLERVIFGNALRRTSDRLLQTADSAFPAACFIKYPSTSFA